MAASWREEARQDRLVRAQIGRDRETARAQARITEGQASARVRREEHQARASARQQARKARAARRKDRAAWLRGHTVDALFVPVIVVPAVLAWTAMAAYGEQVYGPTGRALPAFSEGAMWAFAAATTMTRRRHPDRPVWHLRAGTVLFAAVGAALNFVHAMTTLPGGPPPRGPVTGVVYAVVSVAGVSVHQMVTAGPRRPAADRGAARIARVTARRELAARRAALRERCCRHRRARQCPAGLRARPGRPSPPPRAVPGSHLSRATARRRHCRCSRPGRPALGHGRCPHWRPHPAAHPGPYPPPHPHPGAPAPNRTRLPGAAPGR